METTLDSCLNQCHVPLPQVGLANMNSSATLDCNLWEGWRWLHSQGSTKSIPRTVKQSQVHCAGLNRFSIQNTFFSLFISVLAHAGYQDTFVSCCLKSPTIFLELVFLSQLLSVALCYVEKLLGAAQVSYQSWSSSTGWSKFFYLELFKPTGFFFPSSS